MVAITPPTKLSMSSSLRFAILGNLLLRLASSGTGVMLGLYLRYINDTRYPISAVEVGLFSATFYAAELLLAPVFGGLSDRFGRKLFIALGSVFGLVAVLITGSTTLLLVLLLTRLLEGFSTASSAPAVLGLLSSETRDSDNVRGSSMAFFEVTTVVGLAGGAAMGGFLWQAFHFRAFFIVAGVYTASLLVFMLIRDQKDAALTPHAGFSRYLKVLATPRVLRFAPAWLAINAIVGVWFSHGIFQLAGRHAHGTQFLEQGLSGGTIGTVFAVFGVLFALGCILWGRFYANFTRPNMMLIALGGVFVAIAALFGINHFGFAGGGVVAGFLVVLGGSVVVFSGFTPAALGYLAEIAESRPEDRGTIMGFYSIFLGGGQLLGGLLGGPFADARGVDGMIILTLLLSAVALVTVLILKAYGSESIQAARLEVAAD